MPAPRSFSLARLGLQVAPFAALTLAVGRLLQAYAQGYGTVLFYAGAGGVALALLVLQVWVLARSDQALAWAGSRVEGPGGLAALGVGAAAATLLAESSQLELLSAVLCPFLAWGAASRFPLKQVGQAVPGAAVATKWLRVALGSGALLLWLEVEQIWGGGYHQIANGLGVLGLLVLLWVWLRETPQHAVAWWDGVAQARATPWLVAPAVLLRLPLQSVGGPGSLLLANALWPIMLWLLWRRLCPTGDLTVRAERWTWGLIFGVGLTMRTAYLVALPRIEWHPDSSNYAGALQWYLEGEGFVPHYLRPPLMAVFIFVVVWPTGSYLVLLALQHALGLGAAAWAGRALRGRHHPGRGLVVFGILALSPRLIAHEHNLLAETLSSICSVVAVVCFVRTLSTSERAEGAALSGAGGLGLWSGLAVLARPACAPAALVFALVAVWRWRRPAHWSRLVVCGLAMGGPVLGWCAVNHQRIGIFSLSSQSDVLWFELTASQTQLDTPIQAEFKSVVRPYIEQQRAAPGWQEFDLFPFMYHPKVYPYDLPMMEGRSIREVNAVLSDVASETIRANPGYLPRRSVYILLRFAQLSHPDSALRPWEVASSASLPWERPVVPVPGRDLVNTPWVLALEDAPYDRFWLYELGARGPSRLLSWALPLHAIEQLLAILALLVVGVSCRRRGSVLPLALAGAGTIALICIINGLDIRHPAQCLPYVAVGLGFLVGRSRRGLRPEKLA
ncbi:hypothetical protein OAX78_01610 [Planctomycetota bacterium]|nr:hypothetical protein [Planctomycetota bacterium]